MRTVVIQKPPFRSPNQLEKLPQLGQTPRVSKPGLTITFSGASADDAETLVALRIEAMRESLERVGRFDPVRARERFLSGFSPLHTRHIHVNGQRVGFVVVKPVEQGLLLDHLYIRPAHQGKGIGAVVLSRVFSETEAANCPIRVGALRESASNRFYIRHGFVLVEQGEFDNYYVRYAPVKE